MKRETKQLKELKAQYSMLNMKDFAGVLSAQFDKLIPNTSKLADMYLTAANDTANVEREFSLQNSVITDRRGSILIDNMSVKVSNKEYSNIFGPSVTGNLLEKAARKFDSSKNRRIRKL